MERPIARLGDPCVSSTGKPGKITSASQDFYADGMPAARMGDIVTFVDGSTTTVVEGDPFVFDGARPICRVGYRLAEGGRIGGGAPTVTSGSPTPGAGTVAERTLIAARSEGAAFTHPDCAQRVAAASAAAVPAPPDAPPHADDATAVPLTRDLADGGRPAFHGVDADGSTGVA